MVHVFLKSTELVYIHFLEMLERFISTINKQIPTPGSKNTKFHHDNSKPHVAEFVKSCLKRNLPK